MKFSDDTLNILKNFATINPSILFRPGNVISTMAVNKTIVSKATIQETLDKRFAIYELSKFLGVISIFDEPTFDFQDNKVVISQGKQRISYAYADESVIVAAPDKEITMPSTDIAFSLTADQLNSVVKAINVLQLPEFAIVGEDGELSVMAVNSKNQSSDVYKLALGETDKNFNMYISVDKLKLIPKNYDITVSAKGLVRFTSDVQTYWIATETHSKFKG